MGDAVLLLCSTVFPAKTGLPAVLLLSIPPLRLPLQRWPAC